MSAKFEGSQKNYWKLYSIASTVLCNSFLFYYHKNIPFSLSCLTLRLLAITFQSINEFQIVFSTQAHFTYLVFFKWANPGLFLFIFVLFSLQFQYKLKKM